MEEPHGPPGAGPLSPVSINGSEWSGIYGNDSPQIGARQLATPPASSSSSGIMSSFPPRGPGENHTGGNPSPPASVARSSNGVNMYNQRDSTMSTTNEQFEPILSEHYVALKRFLAASLRDEKGNPRPNRARDKLLRLSPVQFQELSTDVFDELLRRQAAARKPTNGSPPKAVPQYLLPKPAFHPKRNQARQKLSTLPPPRFRDLATDVFYELERRFPRFAGGDISRIGSPASVRGPPRSQTGTPVNGMRPGSRGPMGGVRRPSNASSIAPYPRSDSRNGPRPGGNGMPDGSPVLPPTDYSRPQAKTFQSNTMIPNKSTMVEDDSGGEDDEFALENAASSRTSKRSDGASSETDKKLIEDYQSQMAELREKLDAMEDQLRQKDEELQVEKSHVASSGNEKKEWEELRSSLEEKLTSAQSLNESLQSELERVQSDRTSLERDLRAQIDDLHLQKTEPSSGDQDLARENQELKAELASQQHLTQQVRQDAQECLIEMKRLSERSQADLERETQLQQHITRLEGEVKEWNSRYAKAKTQLRNLKGSSIGLPLSYDAAKFARESGFIDDNGLVKDVHITHFQISVDELLRTARTEEPPRVIDSMKSVVVNVRHILHDVDQAGELPSDQLKLKARVSATANNVITASRNFAAASGLSPVSLLDAAASHLVASTVELVRVVKVRPTPADELDEEDNASIPSNTTISIRDDRPAQANGVFSNGRPRGLSSNSSMYSPANSPRGSMMRHSRGKESVYSRRSNYQASGLSNGRGPQNGAYGVQQDQDVAELKTYLEDQTAVLVSTIQSLVSSIRSDAGFTAINTQIDAIAAVVGKVAAATDSTISSTSNAHLRTQAEPIVQKLDSCRERLLEAGVLGRNIADAEDEDDAEWRHWTQSLPPIAFEIARETKELVQRVDAVDAGDHDGDFA